MAANKKLNNCNTKKNVVRSLFSTESIVKKPAETITRNTETPSLTRQIIDNDITILEKSPDLQSSTILNTGHCIACNFNKYNNISFYL